MLISCIFVFFRYARLFGVGVRERLMTSAQEIALKHDDLEINRQATKLYEALKD